MKALLSVGTLLVLSMVTVWNAALANDNFGGIFSPAFSEISGYVSGEVSFFPKVGLLNFSRPLSLETTSNG